MRIIAGRRKGTVLRGANVSSCKPTTDLVKGSIFDTIGKGVEGTLFFDLFAGSGSIGIEALSRGAERVVFAEYNRRLVEVIRTNLERCHFGEEAATIYSGDALKFIKNFSQSQQSVDIIFADPPYYGDIADELIDIVLRSGHFFCKLFILEHSRGFEWEREGLPVEYRVRSFGQTSISYFKYNRFME